MRSRGVAVCRTAATGSAGVAMNKGPSRSCGHPGKPSPGGGRRPWGTVTIMNAKPPKALKALEMSVRHATVGQQPPHERGLVLQQMRGELDGGRVRGRLGGRL